MAYAESKDLVRRTQSDKVLTDKTFEIASNPHDAYQRRLVATVYKLFDKISAGSNNATLANKSALNSVPYYQLANELHWKIIRKFQRRKDYSSFRDNIWEVDLADIQPLKE